MLKAASLATAAGGAAPLTARIPLPYNFDSANDAKAKAAFRRPHFGKMAATLTPCEKSMRGRRCSDRMDDSRPDRDRRLVLSLAAQQLRPLAGQPQVPVGRQTVVGDKAARPGRGIAHLEYGRALVDLV